MVPQGALTLGELRAALIRSAWAGATERGRENGGGKWCAEDDTMYSKVLRLDSLDIKFGTVLGQLSGCHLRKTVPHHSLNLISGSRWPKAVAKSCGGHIQSIHHVIQAVASCQISSCGQKLWPKAVADISSLYIT